MLTDQVDRQTSFDFSESLNNCPDRERTYQDALTNLDFAQQALAISDSPELPESLARLDETLSVPWPAAGYRFRVLRPHAKGGLGQVLVARDLELNREAALKQIQCRYADDPQNRSRFVMEAEITGNLEHPGIVPIYGLGAYADGRPFYAMRFIRGQSLHEAIARFHSAHAPPLAALRGCRLDHDLEFRKLLAHFEAVCHTIAYAHSRGILHRDIKPGNIMLGDYGETLVVDWGLAKEIGGPATGERSPARTNASQSETHSSKSSRRASVGGSHETRQGEVVGTPGFLCPEQAQGLLEQLGPASDVYSLGATLYCLLTGSPPHGRDPDIGAVLRKTQSGDFARPCRLNAGVPRSLEAICLKAMALRPADRYPTPTELAIDLENWLADEPVAAYREPFAVRTRRWLRSHPRSVTAFAATVFVGLASRAIAAVVSGKNDQLSIAHQHEQQQRHQADERRLEAESAHRQEEQARRQAEAAEMVSNYLIASFRNPDTNRDGRTLTVAELLQSAVARLHGEFGDEPVVKSHLLEAIGKSYQNLGMNEQAEKLFDSARRLQEESLGDDDLRMLTSIEASGLNRYSAGKLDKALPLLEEMLERSRAARGADDKQTMAAMNNLALGYLAAGRISASITLLQQTLERRQAILGPAHPHTLCSMNNLARAYQDAGRNEEALRMYQDVLQRRKELLPENHPLIASSMNNVAAAMSAAGQTEQALPIHEQALEKTRAALGPDNAQTHAAMNNLAKAYHAAGKLDRALPLWEQALARQQQALGEHHADVLVTQHNLATAYRRSGRHAEAAPLFGRCLELLKSRLGPDHPETISLQKELAEANRSARDAERKGP